MAQSAAKRTITWIVRIHSHTWHQHCYNQFVRSQLSYHIIWKLIPPKTSAVEAALLARGNNNAEQAVLGHKRSAEWLQEEFLSLGKGTYKLGIGTYARPYGHLIPHPVVHILVCIECNLPIN